jgi:hypothetical protein
MIETSSNYRLNRLQSVGFSVFWVNFGNIHVVFCGLHPGPSATLKALRLDPCHQPQDIAPAEDAVDAAIEQKKHAVDLGAANALRNMWGVPLSWGIPKLAGW